MMLKGPKPKTKQKEVHPLKKRLRGTRKLIYLQFNPFSKVCRVAVFLSSLVSVSFNHKLETT